MVHGEVYGGVYGAFRPIQRSVVDGAEWRFSRAEICVWGVYFSAERLLMRRGDDLRNKKRPKWILPSRAVL